MFNFKTYLQMIDFKKNFSDSTLKDKIPTYNKVRKVVQDLTILEYVERTQDVNKGLLFNDFSLKSLIDSDNIDLLNPIGPISRGTLVDSDNLVTNSSNLSDALNTKKDNE